MANMDDFLDVIKSLDNKVLMLKDTSTASNSLLQELVGINKSTLQTSKESIKDARRAASLGKSGGGLLQGVGGVMSGAGGALSGAGNLVSGVGTGIGGILGGAGKGIGLAGLGIGAAALGLSTVMDKLDPDAIKSGVETLLSIGEGYDSNVEFLMAGGSLGLALAGIGAGLAVFSVGQFAQGLAQFVTDDNWAQTVKDNVGTLLSIGESSSFGTVGVLVKGGALGLALTGLGAGLAVFSVGQAATGLAQFVTGDGWAQEVHDSVETLLSISELPGASWSGVGTFIGTMGGLAVGLAAFALGKGAEGVAEVGQEGLTYFTGQAGFAKRVKSEVETLLSITQLEGVGADTAGFVGIMGGIALGLAAFAYGKGIEGGATAIQGALSYFTGEEPFADRIYNEVSTLLSITSLANEGQATSFVSAMSQISAGLLAFGAGELVGTLASAGASIVKFFTGAESPFDQIRTIADNADELTMGADALDRLSASLANIGRLQFDGSNLNLREFANDLKNSVPIIEAAIMGEQGGLFFGTEIKGLASAEIDYQGAIRNINMLKGSIIGAPISAERSTAIAEGSSRMSSAMINNIAPTQMNSGGNVSNSGNSNTTIVNNSVDAYRSLDPALAR